MTRHLRWWDWCILGFVLGTAAWSAAVGFWWAAVLLTIEAVLYGGLVWSLRGYLRERDIGSDLLDRVLELEHQARIEAVRNAKPWEGR